MTWQIEFTQAARKDLRGIAVPDRKRIITFLEERVAEHPDPRSLAKRLAGGEAERWRFRVGDYRIIASIQDRVLLITVITIGHRREVYR